MTQRTSDRAPEGTTRGASRVGGAPGHKRKAGWLPWLLLGALALLALLAFLLLRNAGDEGDDQALDTTDDPAASAGTGDDDTAADAGGDDDAGGSATTAAPSTTAGGTAAGGDSGGAAATLTAGGQDVFAAVGDGGLASLSAQPVEGQGVTVESVVADEGFWVGQPDQRVFVYLTPEARSSEGESPFQVEAGQRIDMTGTLRPVPQDITPFGVDESEGAQELLDQGQYVEATSIALNG